MRQFLVASGVLAAVLFLPACTSTSGTGVAVGSGAAATIAQAGEDDPLICENYIPAGTRVARKVCIRKSQRDRIRAESQTITEENQRRAVLGSPTGN